MSISWLPSHLICNRVITIRVSRQIKLISTRSLGGSTLQGLVHCSSLWVCSVSPTLLVSSSAALSIMERIHGTRTGFFERTWIVYYSEPIVDGSYSPSSDDWLYNSRWDLLIQNRDQIDIVEVGVQTGTFSMFLWMSSARLDYFMER